GVLPVQNTLAGVLRDSCRLLAGAPVTVLDELTLPISHTLIALAATPLSALRSVRSHPAALAQCRRFLRAHPAIAPIAAADTASAVESIVRDSTPTVAAIAGAPAAALYGARILLNGIEDCPGNCTRFLIFARTITHGAYSESPYRFR
ncbi:MAG TPA: prephenate dehydratase domain-containing protein, partial [Gammaproteobacteria bacterium]|nr:prephenate dehydratase domain-containing protein [Gammaproteobacteria bacterium]